MVLCRSVCSYLPRGCVRNKDDTIVFVKPLCAFRHNPAERGQIEELVKAWGQPISELHIGTDDLEAKLGDN